MLSNVEIDDGWRDAVLEALASEGPESDHSTDIRRIEGAMANLRKQHLWGAIGDQEFKSQHQILQRQLRTLTSLQSPKMTLNLDRAAQLLQNLLAFGSTRG